MTTIVVMLLGMAAVGFMLYFFVALCRERRGERCHVVHIVRPTDPAKKENVPAFSDRSAHAGLVIRKRWPNGASTWGGGLRLSRSIVRGFWLAGCGEYMTSTGSIAGHSVDLLYDPGRAAWSFFGRADFSFVRTNSFAPGDALGTAGTNLNQPGWLKLGSCFDGKTAYRHVN